MTEKICFNIAKMTESFLLCLPEIFNVILLLISIRQMYQGIEILHPVFLILFCNLIATFLSSTMSIFAYLFEACIKYSTFIIANSGVCLIFHCCCWCLISGNNFTTTFFTCTIGNFFLAWYY